MNTEIIIWYKNIFKEEGPLINEATAAQMCGVGTSCISKWIKKDKLTPIHDPDGRKLLSFKQVQEVALQHSLKHAK